MSLPPERTPSRVQRKNWIPKRSTLHSPRGYIVAQAVGGDLFFSPHSPITRCKVV